MQAFASFKERGLLSRYGAQASHCGGVLNLGCVGFSSCSMWALELGTSSCAHLLSVSLFSAPFFPICLVFHLLCFFPGFSG